MSDQFLLWGKVMLIGAGLAGVRYWTGGPLTYFSWWVAFYCGAMIGVALSS